MNRLHVLSVLSVLILCSASDPALGEVRGQKGPGSNNQSAGSSSGSGHTKSEPGTSSQSGRRQRNGEPQDPPSSGTTPDPLDTGMTSGGTPPAPDTGTGTTTPTDPDDPDGSTGEPDHGDGQLPPGTWVRTFDPPSYMPNVSITSSFNHWDVSDPVLGQLMIAPNWPITLPQPSDLPYQVSRTWTPAANGIDLTFTIFNPTSETHPLPKLQVPGIVLSNQIELLDFTPDTHFIEQTYTPGITTVCPHVPYPRIQYAPIIVAKDDRFSVGVALHYPVLEHGDKVFMMLRKNYSMDNWLALALLDGTIGPGQTKTFGISVRFLGPDGLDWIHTLEPYKNYLRDTYGSPRYTQDLRPVYGRQLAFVSYLGPDNPRGFHPSTRPDINGWEEDVSRLINHCHNFGYERLMVWTPSGGYMHHPENNYPPQMMTEWLQPMIDTASAWHDIPTAGLQLGFWWGRSGQVADQWDDPELEVFDFSNPEHMSAKLHEVELAAARGATMIGLDSFRFVHPAIAVPWIEQMRSVAPGVQFVGEPSSNDVMNIHIPLFGEYETLTKAPLLHDYLVPGRELWVRHSGPHASIALATRSIGWGMTVVIENVNFEATALHEAVAAAQSGWVLPPNAAVVPSPDMFVGD